jgi:hypothetical protein
VNHWQNLTAVGEQMDNLGYENSRLKQRISELEKVAAEVVAELRERSEAESKSGRYSYDTKEAYHDGRAQAYESAADLVAEKLGVGNG